MSRVAIAGWGAVSPAGWGVAPLRDALAKGALLPRQELARPVPRAPLRVMKVPPPDPRPAFLSHPRLRRSSPITQFALGAALEALGSRAPETTSDVGVIVCIFSGCVNYSRRFYQECLKDPATASPLVFPETVFNAPASHLSAYLGSTAINYTLVGDAGTMLVALAIAAGWVLEGRMRECLVVGTEEIDWLTADALGLFERSNCLSEGAGAVLLRLDESPGSIYIDSVTDEFLYTLNGKLAALEQMHQEITLDRDSSPNSILSESTSRSKHLSRAEAAIWRDWPGSRIAPKKVLGEGLMAAAAWELVASADALARNTAREALISIAGFHQHAIGARIRKS